jgi:diguanylate cyclase (GGDEF)-like protein
MVSAGGKVQTGSRRVLTLDESSPREARRAYLVGVALIAAGLVAALLVAGVVGLALVQQRSDAWARSVRSGENLRTLLAQDISNRFRAIDNVLNELATNIADERIPVTSKPSLVIRAAAADGYIDSIYVLDPSGTIVIDGRVPPRHGNLSDRGFFEIHQEIPNYGIYVSEPYEIRPGVPVLTFSRRYNTPTGAFGGVVVINFHLDYIRDLFESVDLGTGGVVSLTQASGLVVVRYPPVDSKMSMGLDLARTPIFQRIRRERIGTFAARAAIDGVERLYAFTPVEGANMYLSVGLSVETVYAQWTSRALLIGGSTLAICVLLVALAYFLRNELRRRTAAEAELAALSVTDALTGLPNRRQFDRFLGREWRRAVRTGGCLSLLLIDADHFKAINDRFGHARGDEVLRSLGTLIEGAIRRPGDLAARYGGEEFAVVLPDTTIAGALVIAKTIQERLASAQEGLGPKDPLVTVSIGATSLCPTGADSIDDFIASADEALYRAKSDGRNHVRSAAPRAAST